MVKTRFYLDCRRAKADGLGTLKISIFKDNVRALIPLNIKLPPKFWDPEGQVAKGDYADLNPMLLQRKAVIDAFIFKKESFGELVGMRSCEIKDLIIAHLFGETPVVEEVPANNFKSLYLDFENSKINSGTRRLYAETWKLIEKFGRKEHFKPERLSFEDITVKWLADFNGFMAETSNSQNYRNIHLRNIRAVFNYAIDEEVTSAYPFRRFKIKAVETEKRSLSVERLRELFEYPVEEYQRKYVDYFKLMFLLMGINSADLFRLKEIKDGRVVFNRAKTGKLYSIKVEPEAMEIIERYRGKDYLLDVCDRYKDHLEFVRHMDHELKKIGKMVRIGRGGKKKITPAFPELSTYWARHTWATLAAEIEVKDATIARALGHMPENKTTEIYIRRNRKKVDIANRKVIDWVLYDKRED